MGAWQTAICESRGQCEIFGKLPQVYVLAILHYYRESMEQGSRGFDLASATFWHGLVTPDIFAATLEASGQSGVADMGYESFAEYVATSTPAHVPQIDNPWPVLVSNAVGIEDGWSRIVTYMRAGIIIPVVLW